MSELIPFPGSRLPSIHIDSFDTLYDETRIAVGRRKDGITVADLKEVAAQRQSIHGLQRLEFHLSQARAKFITLHVRNEESRKAALIKLAQHTYTIGLDINYPELMDWARDELVDGVGTNQAAIFIQNIKLRKRLAQVQTRTFSNDVETTT